MGASHIIYGFHAVAAALTHQPDKILGIFGDPKIVSPRMAEITALASQAQLTVQPMSRDKLNALSESSQHQGIVARLQSRPDMTEKQLLNWVENTDKQPLLLVLEGIQDPHNIGACLRSAQAFGVDYVLLPKAHTAPLNATVSKVASGALEQLPVVMVSNVVRILTALKERGIWVLAAHAGADNTLAATDLKRPIAWVMGPEGKGLKRLTLEVCDAKVGIPLQPGMASLNVSVATGICLYESARQNA